MEIFSTGILPPLLYDNSVVSALYHWLDGRGLIAERSKIFFLHSVQSGCGTHPTSYSVGIEGCFSGIKEVGA
jgi:hypothetical protein